MCSKLVLLEYLCEYNCEAFRLIDGIEFHNKIPLMNIYGHKQFKSSSEFLDMLEKFKNDIVERGMNLYYWLYVFGFKRIFIRQHINNILKSYRNICEQKHMVEKYRNIKMLCENKERNFLIESRFSDWEKSCRVYILISFDENMKIQKIYPLFVGVNHICCYNRKDIGNLKKFLQDEANYM